MCLEEAGVAEADAIIIGPADDLNAKEVGFPIVFLLSFICSFILSQAAALMEGAVMAEGQI